MSSPALTVLGVFLALTASSCVALGNMAMKKDAIVVANDPINQQNNPFRKYILISCLAYIGNFGLTFWSLAYLNLDVWATLLPATIVFNAIFAYFFFGERMRRFQWLGVFFIISGATIAASFGNHVEREYTGHHLWHLAGKWKFLIYVSITLPIFFISICITIIAIRSIRVLNIENVLKSDVHLKIPRVVTIVDEEQTGDSRGSIVQCRRRLSSFVIEGGNYDSIDGDDSKYQYTIRSFLKPSLHTWTKTIDIGDENIVENREDNREVVVSSRYVNSSLDIDVNNNIQNDKNINNHINPLNDTLNDTEENNNKRIDIGDNHLNDLNLDEHLPKSILENHKNSSQLSLLTRLSLKPSIRLLSSAFIYGYQTSITQLLSDTTTELFKAEGFSTVLAHGPSYILFIFLIISSLLELLFDNWMMRCFDTVISVPVYETLNMFLTIAWGYIYFQNEPSSYIGFFGGAILAVIGVGIMALRGVQRK